MPGVCYADDPALVVQEHVKGDIIVISGYLPIESLNKYEYP
jgi:hypothetical protein